MTRRVAEQRCSLHALPPARGSFRSIRTFLILLAVAALASPEALAQAFIEQDELLAGDAFVGDNFGISVAISGDTAIVGANMDDDLGDGSGSAYVFERNPAGIWVELEKLTASNGTAGDNFGISVAISGSTAIVGAQSKNENHGAAYIFERDAGGPNQWGQVKVLSLSVFSVFGIDVSISNDTVIVGAAAETPGGVNAEGTAYIFRRDQGGAGNWGQVKQLTSGAPAFGGNFGVSVSISGDTAIVGAFNEDPGSLTDAGAAYVFRRDEGGAENWGQVDQLTASDGLATDRFGRAVWVSGDTAIVGAPEDDFAVNFESAGSAYVFERNQAGDWIETRKLNAGNPGATDQFGISVSIEGDTAVVGSPFEEFDGGVDDEGSAYLFSRDQGGVNNWGQIEKLTLSVPPSTDANFGAGVSLGGGAVVIGAPRLDHDDQVNAGAAYVFVVAPTAVPSLSPAAAVATACLLLLASAVALRRKSAV